MNETVTTNDPQIRHTPQCMVDGVTPPFVVESYESEAAYEEGSALLLGYGYRVSCRRYGQQPALGWRVRYAYVGKDSPAHTAPDDLPRQRSEFAILLRRYTQLSWSTSASDRRERASLDQPLMNLYLAMHPTSRYSQFDDFESVVRSGQRK
jgi:hypothetical protein